LSIKKTPSRCELLALQMRSSVTTEIGDQRQRQAEFAALDDLPQRVRLALMFSPAKHSAISVMQAMRDPKIAATEDEIVEAIALKNYQMCVEYRRDMASGVFITRRNR